MAILETRFFIPTTEDTVFGGKLNHRIRFDLLETNLRVMFGACTQDTSLYKRVTLGTAAQDSGSYKGVYTDEDTNALVEDSCFQYILALEEKMIPLLREYLRTEVTILFGQKSIYFYNGREVEFIKRPA